MKKLISMLLVLAMAFSLVSFAAAEEGKDDGKLTIWTWDPTFNVKAMNIAIDMYKKDHPDAEIVIEEVLSADLQTRLITAASSGDTSTLPDIFLHQDNAFQKFVLNYPDLFEDITGKYDFTGFGEGKVAFSVVDGKNYGIPFDAGTAVGAWRKDFLEEAGYKPEDLNNITWDKFIEIGKDVKAKTNRPMLSGEAGAVDMVMMMLASAGGSLFAEDGSVHMKDNPALLEAIEKYTTMVKEGVFVEVNNWDEYIGTLSNQTVVGTIQGCWILSTIMSLKDQAGKWALTNCPALDKSEGATNYTSNGGSSWALVKGKDTTLALDFMQAYRNVDFYNAILPETSAIATFAPAAEGPAYTAGSEFFNGEPIFSTILEYTKHVPAVVTGAYYYDARAALATAITNILNGGDMDAELTTAEETVNFNMNV